MHIVYSACGETVKSEFFMSLKSLYLFAVSGFVREPAYYHIHVLSDGAVSKEDLAFLRPLSNFKASVHPKFPGATTLFKLCSTERMYLHQHADFKDLDKVMTEPESGYCNQFLSGYCMLAHQADITGLLRGLKWHHTSHDFVLIVLQVIYVDTDTLWLDDAVFWWTHFKHVGTMRAAFGLAENAGGVNGSWYSNGDSLPASDLHLVNAVQAACSYMMPAHFCKKKDGCSWHAMCISAQHFQGSVQI